MTDRPTQFTRGFCCYCGARTVSTRAIACNAHKDLLLLDEYALALYDKSK